MANNLYNKQVTPKGYKSGGEVKKDYKLGTKIQGDYKGKTTSGKIKEFVKTAAKQTAGTAKNIAKKFRTKKMGGGMMMQRPMMEKGGKIMEAAKAAAKKGKDKRASDRMKNSKPNKKSGSSAVDVFKSYGKYDGKPIELKDGGSLKAVPAGNKGLKKLPTKVRNKMGFMKKGGKVHGK